MVRCRSTRFNIKHFFFRARNKEEHMKVIFTAETEGETNPQSFPTEVKPGQSY